MRQPAACSVFPRNEILLAVLLISCAAAAAPARGADGSGADGLQQNQLMRQQQQDALQLRMLQQQRALEAPPAGSRERQDLERLQINQQQRQQDLQYRQQTEPSMVRPDRESGVSSVVVEQGPGKAQEQGANQLQRFDSDLQKRAETLREEKARGQVRAPGPPATLQ